MTHPLASIPDFSTRDSELRRSSYPFPQTFIPPVVLGTFLVLGGVTLAGCRTKMPGGLGSTVVAEIDGHAVTAADLEADVANQTPFIKAQRQLPDERAKLITRLVNFEAMAAEARDRGLDRDPEILRTLKQAMVSKLISSQVIPPPVVPSDDTIKHFYDTHLAEFTAPERVRVTDLTTADPRQAQKARFLASALSRSDDLGFRRLVGQFGNDRANSARGGDLGYLTRGSAGVPRPVVEAAFNLRQVGDLSGLIQVGDSTHLLRLTDRQPAGPEPLPVARDRIISSLSIEDRSQAIESWSVAVRARHKVRIFDDKLADVHF